MYGVCRLARDHSPAPHSLSPQKKKAVLSKNSLLAFSFDVYALENTSQTGTGAPVGLGLHFFIGNEAQGRTADAVAHAVGRLGSTSEHMIEVGVSGATADFCAAQPLSSSAAASRIGSTLRYMAYPSFSRR